MQDREKSIEPSGQQGFTLIEVLVALALLGMIVLLFSQALRGGASVTSRAAEISTQSELRQVRNYLSAAISSSMPFQTFGDEGRYSAVFHGKAQQLSFVTSHTVPGQYSGLYVTKLHLVPSSNRSRNFDLWLDQHLFHRFAKSDRRVSPRVKLLEDIANVRFRYYGYETDRILPDWLSGWNDPKKVPSLVSVEIDFGLDDERKWLPLVVQLRVKP